MAELTEKQKRFADYMRIRLRAAEDLLKRYTLNGLVWDTEKQSKIKMECMEVISDKGSKPWQKKAARILLNAIYGPAKANEMIEDIAIVTDRNDSLVFKWKRKVIKRDKKCVHCGNENDLQAHHISHWADDPLNRINVDNGITLCSLCHSTEHPELSSNLFAMG